jgi:sugar lactone lactonase YvrE
MGVTWWSSDPTIFAIQEPGQNGSHLDMLHATPFGMGVAHQSDALYWAFNGDAGAIDKYDFKSSHEPGGADHSDGEIYRYVLGQVARMPEVPSHPAFDSARKTLYIADTGNHRVVSLDTAAGSVASDQFEVFDPVQAHDYVELVGLVDVVPPGTLEAPSGIAWFADLLFVTDNATSRIHAFDPTGKLVRTLDTGLPPGTLAGVTVGPDKKMYFGDLLSAEVRRIDPI